MAYFNYRNLDPTEFEALAKDVMERRLGCRLFRYAQGRDGGIDLCDDISKKHVVVQCKRYQQGSFDNLYGVLKREEKPKIDMLIPRPDKYYVFTSLDLLPEQKTKILDLFRDYMTDESCIVDGIAINDFFRDERNHDLVSRNIKLFLSFPDNYQYSLADHSQLEKNKLYDQLLEIFENDRKNHPSIRMMDPDPSLFPKGLPEIMSDGRLAVEGHESPRAIRDMVRDSWKREDQRHILLVGEGGIGKTVAMLTLPEEDWFKNLRIPVIYVPLQRLDVFKGDLNRYIREKIGDNHYTRCIELANSIPEGHPELLLLLDGFNEIPDTYKKEAGKYIREWMEKPGVQIITTSRMGFFLENRFSKYRLQPLPYDTVRSFLLAAGITEEQLPGQKDRIWGVINVPLMLAMYIQIEKVRETAELSPAAPVLEWKEPDNAAHIIWNYLQMELYRCTDREDPTYSALRYAVAILAVAPYICCQMSNRNRFYIKREEFHVFIREALSFYAAHQSLTDGQILKVREEFDPYHEEELFPEVDPASYARILIDNIGLFQSQRSPRTGHERGGTTDYTCSLRHQNFRDALAAFFICSCLPKTNDSKVKKELLDQANYYVKNYMAEHFSTKDLISIWEKHRQEEPEDGQITFILMDLIGRQRNYDYRDLDFSGVDLTKTNLHTLLSRRLDICPLPKDRSRFSSTKISIDCLSPSCHEDPVNSVAFHPDGRLLASGASDKTVRIWDLESGECHILKGHTGGVTSVAFSPDKRYVASGSSDQTVRIWDLKSEKSYQLKGHNGVVTSVAFSPDGKELASGSLDKTVRIWTLANNESRALDTQTGRICSVAFCSIGRQIASGSSDGAIRIWNLARDECQELDDCQGFVYSVAFSPDGQSLASSSNDSDVRIWDLKSGNCRLLKGQNGKVTTVTFSPDGRHIASGTDSGNVLIWDIDSETSRRLESCTGKINSVIFSPDGRQIVSGADNGTIRIQDLDSGLSRTLAGLASNINRVTFSHNGKQIASHVDDETIRVWTLEGEETCVLKCLAEKVYNISSGHDSWLYAGATSDKTLRIWELKSGKSIVHKCPEYDVDHINSVAFSPDGMHLAYAADSGAVQIWDLEKDILHRLSIPSPELSIRAFIFMRRKQAILDNNGLKVFSLAFSPDGKMLAGGTNNGKVLIWYVGNGKHRMFEGLSSRVLSVAISPDGRLLGASSYNKEIKLWDLQSRVCHVLQSPGHRVRELSFSPDGRVLAGGASDGTVWIWDLENEKSFVLPGHSGKVRSVNFSPNGRLLASGASDRSVRIWDLDTFQEVRKYVIISHINLSGANFELAIIDEKDKEMLKAAGARV